MKIVDIPGGQGSPEWHAWRATRICASDIAPIMGKSPFGDALSVYNSKKGISQPYVTEAMKRGSDMEGFILQQYNATHDMFCVPLCVERGGFGASLDGYEKEWIVEIKCVSKASFDKIAQKIPLHYYYQVQWQLMVSGAIKAVLVVYCHEDGSMMELPISPCRGAEEEMKQAAKSFLVNHLDPSIPPQTVIPMLEETDRSLRLQELLATKATIDKEIKELKEVLIKEATLQEGSYKRGLLTFAWTQGRTSYDYKAMRESGIDLSAFEKKGEPFYTIKLNKGREG